MGTCSVLFSCRDQRHCEIYSKGRLGACERGVEPFERAGEHFDCLHVAESGEYVTAPPVQVHALQKQERQGGVDWINRQQRSCSVERSQRLGSATGGSEALSVRSSEPCSE